MDCPKGCGEMEIIAKKQISGVGSKPIKHNVRYQCKSCLEIKEIVIEAA